MELDQPLCHRDLVRSAEHGHGPEGGVGDDGQGLAADPRLDQGLHVLGLRVLQVERAQDALVVGPALGRLLIDHDDRARIEDLVEEPIDEGDSVEGVLEGLVDQVHRDGLVAELGIEEDVDAGQPPHRLQDLLEARVLELDPDGGVALGREDGQGTRSCLGPCLHRVVLGQAVALEVAQADAVLHDGKVVGGGLVAGIVVGRDLQLFRRLGELLGQEMPPGQVVVLPAGLDARVLERDLVADVVRVLLEGAGEAGDGQVPVPLPRLSLPLPVGPGGRAAGLEQEGQGQDRPGPLRRSSLARHQFGHQFPVPLSGIRRTCSEPTSWTSTDSSPMRTMR